MKMGFLLKNNARKGMGGKGVFKKGVRKECSKRERKRSAEKRERKRRQKKGLQNSRILKRMAGWRKFANFEGCGKLCLKTSGLAPMLS